MAVIKIDGVEMDLALDRTARTATLMIEGPLVIVEYEIVIHRNGYVEVIAPPIFGTEDHERSRRFYVGD